MPLYRRGRLLLLLWRGWKSPIPLTIQDENGCPILATRMTGNESLKKTRGYIYLINHVNMCILVSCHLLVVVTIAWKRRVREGGALDARIASSLSFKSLRLNWYKGSLFALLSSHHFAKNILINDNMVLTTRGSCGVAGVIAMRPLCCWCSRCCVLVFDTQSSESNLIGGRRSRLVMKSQCVG